MTRTELNSKRLELLQDLRKITRKSGCTIVARHNTILALRNSETKEVTHLIDPKKKKGLIVVGGHIDEFYVPRYEPSTAREWLKEIDEQHEANNKQAQEDIGYHFEKCTLSVKELRAVVVKNMKNRLDFLKFLKKLSDESLAKF